MSLLLNRTIAPLYTFPEKFSLNKPISTNFKGIPIHAFNAPNNEVLRMDWVFKNCYFKGVGFETQDKAVQYLLEGTAQKTAETIISALDYYGAYIDLKQGTEYHTISIYVHPSHVEPVLNIFIEVLNEATYPASQLETLLNIHIDKLKVQQTKTTYQARKKFLSTLFGKQHPIGFFPSTNDLLSIKSSDIRSIKESIFTIDNLSIYVTGKLDGTMHFIEQSINMLGLNQTSLLEEQNNYKLPIFKPDRETIQVNHSSQSTLRLGYPSLQIQHPDYISLHVLTTLFGGYFGSRLMKNIREDKGYTYGIYALLNSYSDTGVWVIAADIGTEYVEDAMVEIKKEMELLQQQSIGDDELGLIKNYIKGVLLNQFDSIFSNTDKYIAMHQGLIPEDYFESYFECLNTLNASKMKDTAQKYLKPHSMLEVIAGPIHDK